jgi:hypothetical protein
LKICTEADYLQAHLTLIEGVSRGRYPTLQKAHQRVTSVLKKWISAANANLTAQSNPLLRLTRLSQGTSLEWTQIWRQGDQEIHAKKSKSSGNRTLTH